MPACETTKPRRSRASLLGGLAAALCTCLAILAGAPAPAAQAATSSGTFLQRASTPVPLTGVSADPETGLIYAQEVEGTAFFSYDPHTNTWSELASAPITTEYGTAGATYLNGKIYVAYLNTTKIGVYDIATNAWSEVASPLVNATGDVAAAGEKLYMAYGEEFASYEPATETTVHLAKAPGMAGCFVSGFSPGGSLQAYNGKIYGDQGEGCRGFAAYDIAEEKWSELAGLPEGPVIGGAIDPVSGEYFAYGPYFGSSFFSYDIAAEEWTTLTSPLTPIKSGGMAFVSLPNVSGVYAVQGGAGTGFVLYTHEPTADLSASANISAGAGNEVIYTLKVENHGPDAAANAILSDSLSGNVSLISAKASQGSCSGTATITCSLGSLPAGGTATVTLTASTKVTVIAQNTVTVESETLDPNLANNTAKVTYAFVLTPATATITIPQSTPAAPVYCVVPNVHGLTLAALKRALTAAHCALGHLSRSSDRKVGRGRGIASNPYRGAVLLAGSRVDVMLSRGARRAARCVVPGKLRGLDVKQAKRRLRAAHCRPGKIRRRHNAKLAKGRVIATRPDHGKRRPAGAKITILVSRGPRRHA